MGRNTTLKIGNAGGFWGDDPGALKRQVEGGHLDYISIDFLAEITMSIMQKQYAKDPTRGYAYDFVSMLEGVLAKLLKNKTKIITNAGGINPKACAKAISALAKSQGLSPKIAIVSGDNIIGKIDAFVAEGILFKNMETGEEFSSVRKRIEAANVYFGAKPVADALSLWDPDIIVTGRVTDTGITLGCMIHEFSWSLDDWDKLSSGIVAGHILECGTQATGGNFSDWHLIKNYMNMGYPIVEVSPDGTFVVTKHSETGGLVSVDTIREQLFYEMGDPKVYLTPDVVADFTTINLKDDGRDRVRVFGVQGYEPTDLYKVSMAHSDGYKCTGSILISGPDAESKAKTFARIFWERLDLSFDETSNEFIGLNSCHKSIGSDGSAREILLRLSARGRDQKSMNVFRKSISSLILSGPPGVTVLSEGVGRIQQVVSYWPALMPKSFVTPEIINFDENNNESIFVEDVAIGKFNSASKADQIAEKAVAKVAEIHTRIKDSDIPLAKLCLARSGDKGDTANIGVIARNIESYNFLYELLTAQFVKDLFQEHCQGKVRRFVVENLLGFNFLLENSLGGGGSKSLRADAQGKTLAQALLSFRVDVPKDIRNDLGV